MYEMYFWLFDLVYKNVIYFNLIGIYVKLVFICIYIKRIIYLFDILVEIGLNYSEYIEVFIEL